MNLKLHTSSVDGWWTLPVNLLLYTPPLKSYAFIYEVDEWSKSISDSLYFLTIALYCETYKSFNEALSIVWSPYVMGQSHWGPEPTRFTPIVCPIESFLKIVRPSLPRKQQDSSRNQHDSSRKQHDRPRNQHDSSRKQHDRPRKLDPILSRDDPGWIGLLNEA